MRYQYVSCIKLRSLAPTSYEIDWEEDEKISEELQKIIWRDARKRLPGQSRTSTRGCYKKMTRKEDSVVSSIDIKNREDNNFLIYANRSLNVSLGKISKEQMEKKKQQNKVKPLRQDRSKIEA